MYCRVDRGIEYRMKVGWIHGRNSRRVGKMGERIGRRRNVGLMEESMEGSIKG